MSRCISCGGAIGHECFNPGECAEITSQMAQQVQAPALMTSDRELIQELTDVLESTFEIGERLLDDVFGYEWLSLAKAAISKAQQGKEDGSFAPGHSVGSPPYANLEGVEATADAESLPADVRRLVIAARHVAFEDHPGKDELRELDAASEAFAARVPWDDEPDSEGGAIATGGFLPEERA